MPFGCTLRRAIVKHRSDRERVSRDTQHVYAYIIENSIRKRIEVGVGLAEDKTAVLTCPAQPLTLRASAPYAQSIFAQSLSNETRQA